MFNNGNLYKTCATGISIQVSSFQVWQLLQKNQGVERHERIVETEPCRDGEGDHPAEHK
jgi:hypothetical protein